MTNFLSYRTKKYAKKGVFCFNLINLFIKITLYLLVISLVSYGMFAYWWYLLRPAFLMEDYNSCVSYHNMNQQLPEYCEPTFVDFTGNRAETEANLIIRKNEFIKLDADRAAANKE